MVSKQLAELTKQLEELARETEQHAENIDRKTVQPPAPATR